MRKNVSIVKGEDPDYDDDGSGWTKVVKKSRVHHDDPGVTAKVKKNQ